MKKLISFGLFAAMMLLMLVALNVSKAQTSTVRETQNTVRPYYQRPHYRHFKRAIAYRPKIFRYQFRYHRYHTPMRPMRRMRLS